MTKNIYILTGGTMVHVTPHFALCAPAYGNVGLEIHKRLSHSLSAREMDNEGNIILVRTKMAGENTHETCAHLAALGANPSPETNDDMQTLVRVILSDANSAAIIMAAAICDFAPVELQAVERNGTTTLTHFGKDQKRLHHVETVTLQMRPSDKIIDGIKNARPDLSLVTFKTTAGVSDDELFSQALHNLQKSQSDLVFANDIQTYRNMVVTANGEQLSGDRSVALEILCERLLDVIMLK